jgi:hypothetical protein
MANAIPFLRQLLASLEEAVLSMRRKDAVGEKTRREMVERYGLSPEDDVVAQVDYYCSVLVSLIEEVQEWELDRIMLDIRM